MAASAPQLAVALQSAVGVDRIHDAHYLLFPGTAGDQCTAVYMIISAAASEGRLLFAVPETCEPCIMPLEFCEHTIACFPHTEAVVGSLHSDEYASDDTTDDDSDSADGPRENGKAGSKTMGKSTTSSLRVVSGQFDPDAQSMICHFSACSPGERLKILFGLRHPLVGGLRMPTASKETEALFVSGAVLITGNTCKDGGRNPSEALSNLKRTLATGTLSRIVEPTHTLGDIEDLRPERVAGIEVLRSRKFLSLYLGEDHVVALG